MANTILAGQKQSDLNCSSELSALFPTWVTHSQCTEITQELSKAGGKDDTGTQKSTPFSATFMSSSNAYPSVSQSALFMSPASRTQPTSPPGEFTPPKSFYSLQSTFLPPLGSSSWTLQNPQQLQNFTSCTTGVTPLQPLKSSTEPGSDSRALNAYKRVEKKKTRSSLNPYRTKRTSTVEHQRFDTILPNLTATIPSIPHPYKPNLTPAPLLLRPHCLARERLILWIPAGEDTRRTATTNDPHEFTISDAQLDRVLEVMGCSWATATKETYGAGLLVFHVYCDAQQIAESQRCPISRPLLLAFLSSCAGAYSGSALGNYAAGIKAWHILHGRPWLIPPNELKSILDGAAKFAPPPPPNAPNALLSPPPSSSTFAKS
ncbi:uncharacterized protein EDB91DRAFT_1244851 [Suillus paluster]|uniref:uncharacterized protein n=1 Tax=Suillus paluster TaxID=48578 RepID=UPI001B86B1F7|nr:uncharacterized protein EDB91DRAFT_1244851 [Suillus paluster]KAG1749062.1 hypothetical protein EDB91DRAFT_1244851 [Suillus paluster]